MQTSVHKISALENLYRSLYENSPDLFRTIDLDGKILDCNKSYANYLGYTKEELIGTSIFKTISDDSIDSMQKSFETWKTTGEVRNRLVFFKKKDGSMFPALVSANNLYDHEGKLIGSNTTIKDVTEIFNIQTKLEERERIISKQYEQLKKLTKQKDEFLAMITHELKSPLVPIQGYTEILLNGHFGKLPERQKEKLQIIKSNANSLLQLINDLIDSQRLEIGELKLDKQIHNLENLISKAVVKILPMADKKSIEIIAETKNEVSCRCDERRLQQVLFQILTNAVDFCPEKNGLIKIKLGQEGKNAKIIVKDNGIGINKTKLSKIFVKFYQTDTSSTRAHPGVGIGLSVCKGLIEQHGGKIWAESGGPEKGAEIHVLIPIND